MHRSGYGSHVARDQIGGVFTDDRDLVGVDDRTNELLRIKADQRPGAAEDACDELRAIGIAVRDRNDTQQYRAIPPDD